VRELAGGRLFNAAPASTPLVPYPAQDWERLHTASRSAVDEAFAQHRIMQAAARRGGDPGDLGWSQDNVAWLLTERGPATATDVADYLGRTNRWIELRGGVRPVCQALYPGVHTVIAYRLLLGIYTGIVPDGIADLGVSDLDWAGDATVLLAYVKGRRAAESLTLPAKAVRLIEQWLAHSAPARAFALAGLRGHLWVHYNYYAARTGSPDRRWTTRIPAPTQRAWATSRSLTVDRRRIRTTYLSLRDRRSWQGSPRSLIDPNHSPAVEGDSYLTAATPAQREAVETVIAAAQQDMLRRAQPPVVLADADTAAAVAGFPRLAASLGGGDAAVAVLVGGEQDVFAAACTDPTAGLHGPPGKPCPARPWVCLLCPLAVFTPRHAANLLRLKAFFARQWQAMPSAQFMAVFGPYATRIDEVLARYPASLLVTAAASVADRDDDLPLRPEERTA